MRPRLALMLLVVMGCGVSLSFAQASRFIPKAWKNGAYFDLYTSYEQDDVSRTAQPYGWDDLFFREKITAFSDGYVYHPRFLQYHLSIAGALKQEQYEASYLDPQGWKYGTGYEYEARLFFLPEHPYNVELFALRYEPLYKEQAAVQHNSVETTQGIYFQYRRKPYLAHARYSLDTIDNGISWTDITRLGLDGEYFKTYRNGNQLSFNAAYNPSRASTSQGLDSDTRQALFGNFFNLKSVRLNSSITQNNYDQENSSAGTFSNDQFAWYEILNAFFPWNLRSNVTYRMQDNQSSYPDATAGGQQDLTDHNRDIQVDVIHRLYQSLDTTYSYLNNARTSTGGETRTTFQSLNFTYTKIIPQGRVLAGTNVGRGSTSSEGTSDIVNEPHTVNLSLDPRFTLAQQNVVESTIVIFVKSPVPPNPIIRLVEGTHYTLLAVGNTYQVTINGANLPPPDFTPTGTYEFLASYSLITADYEIDTRALGFNASVDLFDWTWTPYYSYVAIRSEVVSGVFPGVPLDTTTNTAGVRYQKGPWRARGEYQSLQWEISPYRSWRGEVQYIGALNPTMNFYGTAAYVNKYYPQGTSTDLSEPYTDETASASGNIRKEIPSQGLSFSVGGSVSRTLGRTDTNAYALNSSLSWKIGKMNLSAGANLYGSDTSGYATSDSSRVHQYYYVTLRRVLF